MGLIKDYKWVIAGFVLGALIGLSQMSESAGAIENLVSVIVSSLGLGGIVYGFRLWDKRK